MIDALCRAYNEAADAFLRATTHPDRGLAQFWTLYWFGELHSLASH